ncbi:hypothetical protein ACH5RR_016099 [Cinchona calisaya]|uniref:Endonuclease/exonuclease/phosphatase domain-containing protein n=1 Tax=Cinchona calisaya TaxID=153742 RepID=A0ABD2ZUX8_9GENT
MVENPTKGNQLENNAIIKETNQEFLKSLDEQLSALTKKPNLSLVDEPTVNDDFTIVVHCIPAENQVGHLAICNDSLPNFVSASFVYAKCNVEDWRELWDSLITFSKSCTFAPWFLGGDYNVIKEIAEYVGSYILYCIGINEFCDAFRSSALMYLPYSCSKFSLKSKRNGSHVWKRLDRVLSNQQMLNVFQHVTITHLNETCSDHDPLLLSFFSTQFKVPRLFRFLDIWTSSPTFLFEVDRSWKQFFGSTALQNFSAKL